MATVERQITVNASPEMVFAYVSDVARHSEWAAHKLEVKAAAPGPAQVGSKFETVGHQFGAQPGTVTVTELEAGRKMVFESDGPVGHFRHQFLVDSADGGTRLTKTMEPLKISSLPLKLLSPLVTAVIAPRGLDGDLQRIKANLEGGAPSAAETPAPEAPAPEAPAEPAPEAPAEPAAGPAEGEAEEKPPEGA
jgi:uncharacterized protein YndB with AHSA1/START domain